MKRNMHEKWHKNWVVVKNDIWQANTPVETVAVPTMDTKKLGMLFTLQEGWMGLYFSEYLVVTHEEIKSSSSTLPHQWIK